MGVGDEILNICAPISHFEFWGQVAEIGDCSQEMRTFGCFIWNIKNGKCQTSSHLHHGGECHTHIDVGAKDEQKIRNNYVFY